MVLGVLPCPQVANLEHWVQCEKCDKWRITDRQYGKDEKFLCSDLFPPVRQENGKISGGCNTVADSFPAFDTQLLKQQDIQLSQLCECVQNLLDKLSHSAIGVDSKRRFVNEARSCSTAKDLWTVVRSYGAKKHYLNSFRAHTRVEMLVR
jgi:hypothetical protein